MTDPTQTTDGLTATGDGLSARRAAMLTGTMGIVFSVLFTVSILLVATVPGAKATAADLESFYGGDVRLAPVAVGLYLMPFSGIAFIWFAVALRMWAAASSNVRTVLQSNLQFVGGVAFVILVFVASAASAVNAVSIEVEGAALEPSVARLFPTLGSTLTLFFAIRMAAMFVFTTSSIAGRGAVLPRWFTRLGYVVGAFLLLSPVFAAILVLVFPAWVTVLCILILVAARRIPASVTVRGSSPLPGTAVLSDETAPSTGITPDA